MQILSDGDGVGIWAVPSYLEDRTSLVNGQIGDVALQPDDGSHSGNPLPSWSDDIVLPALISYYVDRAAVITAANTSGEYGWKGSFSGTGATADIATPDATKGYYNQLRTGTTTTGKGGRFFGTHNNFDVTWFATGSAYEWRYECVFRIPTLSDGTNTFACVLGFLRDETVIDQASGAYLKIDTTSQVNAQCVNANASVRTSANSGFNIAAATWYRVVIIGGATDANVDYYLSLETDPVPTSPTVSQSTNNPGTMCAGIGIVKSAGTTDRHLDYAYQLLSWNRMVSK